MGKSPISLRQEICSSNQNFLCAVNINIFLNSDNISTLHQALKPSSNQNWKILRPRRSGWLTSNTGFWSKFFLLNLDRLQQREDGRFQAIIIITTISSCWNIKLPIISLIEGKSKLAGDWAHMLFSYLRLINSLYFYSLEVPTLRRLQFSIIAL